MFGDEDVLRLDVSVDALQEQRVKSAWGAENIKGPCERQGKRKRERVFSGLHASLLNGGLVALVVSRWYINRWSAKGKEFLLKKKKEKKKAIKQQRARGSWRREETGGIRKQAEGKLSRRDNIPHEETKRGESEDESVTYILFVTEVDGLKRLPGYTPHKVLRNTVTHKNKMLSS